jgi:hypothetical protein
VLIKKMTNIIIAAEAQIEAEESGIITIISA